MVDFLFKKISDGLSLNTCPVQGEPPGFAGFLFVDFDGFAGFGVPDLIDSQLQKITVPEIRINPNYYNIVGIRGCPHLPHSGTFLNGP